MLVNCRAQFWTLTHHTYWSRKCTNISETFTISTYKLTRKISLTILLKQYNSTLFFLPCMWTSFLFEEFYTIEVWGWGGGIQSYLLLMVAENPYTWFSSLWFGMDVSTWPVFCDHMSPSQTPNLGAGATEKEEKGDPISSSWTWLWLPSLPHFLLNCPVLFSSFPRIPIGFQ